MRNCARLITILLLLIPLAVTSTTPVPPPHHVYTINIYVLDSAGVPHENIPVGLVARCSGEWWLLRADALQGCGYVYPDAGAVVALTNTKGRAGLEIYTDRLLDSLAVAIISPDSVLTGDVFRTRDQRASYPDLEDYWEEDEGYLCSDSMALRSREVGTVHEFRSDTLIVD